MSTAVTGDRYKPWSRGLQSKLKKGQPSLHCRLLYRFLQELRTLLSDLFRSIVGRRVAESMSTPCALVIFTYSVEPSSAATDCSTDRGDGSDRAGTEASSTVRASQFLAKPLATRPFKGSGHNEPRPAGGREAAAETPTKRRAAAA
jgi:hypothetical protein